MAATVALPLEKQFAGIAGLSNINSVSQQGSTNITLQFDLSRNIDAAAQDVQAMIGRTARSLPPQMPAPPSYQKANPGDQSVILLVLRSATLPLSMVDEYAQQTIAQRLSMVDGRRPGRRLRLAEVRGPHRPGSPRAGRPVDRHRHRRRRRHQRQLERADGHDLRRQDVRRPDERPADARGGRTARRSWPTATGTRCGSTRSRTSSTASRTTSRRRGRLASAAS